MKFEMVAHLKFKSNENQNGILLISSTVFLIQLGGGYNYYLTSIRLSSTAIVRANAFVILLNAFGT